MNRDPTQPNAVDCLLNLPLSVGHLQAEPDLSLISALRDLLALSVYVSCWWIAILFTSSTESEEDRTLSLPALLSTNRLRARRSYLESVFEMEGVPTHVGVVAAERTHMPSLTNSRSSGTSTPIPTAHNDRTGWCDSIDLYFKVKAKRLLNALLWNAANQEFNRITRFAEDLLHQRLVIIVISLNPLLTHSACPYEKRKMCTNHEQECKSEVPEPMANEASPESVWNGLRGITARLGWKMYLNESEGRWSDDRPNITKHQMQHYALNLNTLLWP